MNTAKRSPLFAGAAKVNITPSLDDLHAFCAVRRDQYEGIRQDLFSRIIVLKSDARMILIVGSDLINMPDYFLLRDRLVERFGFKPADIILGGTQNHLSCVTDPPRTNAEEREPILLTIRDKIHDAVMHGVEEAIQKLRPARLGWKSCQSGINIQKDLHTQAGIIIGNAYEGYADHELFILRVDGEDGKPIAALLNFGVQGGFMFTTQKNWICGDIQGAVSEGLETYVGDDFVAAYIIGAAGDMAPIVTANFAVLKTEKGRVIKEEHALPLESRELLLQWLAGQQINDAVTAFDEIQCSTGSVFFRSGEVYTEADARLYPCANPDDDVNRRDAVGTVKHRIHLVSISDDLVFVCGNSITSARLGKLVKNALPCKTVYISVEGGILGYVVDTQADPMGFGARYCPVYSAQESENIYVGSAQKLYATLAE